MNSVLGTPTVHTLTIQDEDTDADGLSDDWEQQIVDDDAGDAIDGIDDVLPGDDYDNDGRANAEEYAAGTDPTINDNSAPEIEILNVTQAGAGPTKTLTVEFRYRDADGDALGMVLRTSSDNGANWDQVPVTTVSGNTSVTGAADWQTGSITWSGGVDWPELRSEQMKVRLSASDGVGE